MQRIELTEEQSRILTEAKGENVEVYDSNGQLVSFMKWLGADGCGRGRPLSASARSSETADHPVGASASDAPPI
jgi:hypothetical protein